MKALVGTSPLLPWWRLQNMTDEEVDKFNRKHLVEIEMTDKRTVGMMAEHIKRSEQEHDIIWNAAIEAAAKICDKYDSYGAAYEIRKVLKK